jgi:predicted DNA-binding transcriptional regulator AlpA
MPRMFDTSFFRGEEIMRERVATSQPLPPVKLRPGDRILSQDEAAKIRGVTRETLRRMSESGIGPRRVQLSPGRFGYLASDFLEI